MAEHSLLTEDGEACRLPPALVWTVLCLSVLPFLLQSFGADFSSTSGGGVHPSLNGGGPLEPWPLPLAGRFAHSLMEWTATSIAVLTALLALLYLRHKGDALVLTLAVTFLFVGFLDAFHTLVADGMLKAIAPGQSLIPITWAVSRLSKALLLAAGAALIIAKRPVPRRSPPYLVPAGALALLGTAYFLVRLLARSSQLPAGCFPDAWVKRPWDLPALAVFAASALWLYPRLLRRQPSLFSHSLLVAAFPEIAAELHMSLGSTALYDAHFHIAHFLKIVAYLVPSAALGLYLIDACRRETNAKEAFERAVGGLRREAAEREQVEKRLRSRELRLAQLTQSIKEVFWIVAPGGSGVVYVSPAYEDIFGRSCESLYEDPRSVLDAVHPDDRERVCSQVRREIHAELGMDFRITRPDDRLRWIRTRIFPVRNEKGEVFRIAGISEDVTRQKEAEAALQRAEARSQALVNALPDLIFRLNRQGVYLDYHAGQGSNLQVAPQEFLGKRVGDVFPELGHQVQEAVERALDTATLQIIEYPFELNGMLRDYEARFVRSGEEEVVAIVRDITARKRLEREILEISTRERRRIGHDLHDGVGQQLTGIALLGKALNRRLDAKDMEEAAEARRIVNLANDAIARTRRLARGLSPVTLQEQGLVSALEELALGVEHFYSVSCRFRCNRKVLIRDHVVADHLYRIAQEAVNNAVRHAEPHRVDIELNSRGDGLTLRVKDDGRGLREDADTAKGMGFHIMRYRARMIDASLHIEGAPGRGTVVTCTLHHKRSATRTGGR